MNNIYNLLQKYCKILLTSNKSIVILVHKKNKQKEIFVNNNNEVSPNQLLLYIYIHTPPIVVGIFF